MLQGTWTCKWNASLIWCILLLEMAMILASSPSISNMEHLETIYGTQERPLFRVSDYIPDRSRATDGLRQAALEAGRRGGRLVFDVPGNYSSGSVLLTGSIEVVIPKGVRILASTIRADYEGGRSSWYLFYFFHCFRCSIIGDGILDGQGREYVIDTAEDCKHVKNFEDPSCALASECRPSIIGIVSSRYTKVHGINIIDPIYWTIHIINSSHVDVQETDIKGDWDIYNTDGIDIDSSSNITIKHCTIDTADDAICIKSTLDNIETKWVRVANCYLRSRSSAIKIGSETLSNISQISFENIQIHDSNRGLGIQLRDKGDVSNILFRNIIIRSLHLHHFRWWGASEVIYVTATPRYRDSVVGSISQVVFENITCYSTENGIFISAIPFCDRIKNLTMQNVNINFMKATDYEGGYQDMRPSMLGVLKSGTTAGIWVDFAQNIKFKNMLLVFEKPLRLDWEAYTNINISTTKNIYLQNCQFEGLPDISLI